MFIMNNRASIIYISAIYIVLFPFLSAPLYAAAFCGPDVVPVTLTWRNGLVSVRPPWRNDWLGVCNLNVEWKGVPTSTCFAWFSQLNNAIANGNEIMMYYADLDQEDCANLPTGEISPAPDYVRISTQ